MAPRTLLQASLALTLVATLGCQSAPTADVLRDQEYARHGELELLADVHRPETTGPAPAVVLVHGGSWARGTRRRMERVAEAVVEHGYVAVNIEYRLAPDHVYPAPVEDVLAAVCWVRRNAERLGVDPERVALWGYSAGAHISALAGSRPDAASDASCAHEHAPVQACVLGSGPMDLRELAGARAVGRFLGGDPDEIPETVEAASPVLAVHAQSPPTFLYHGEDDWIVGVEHSRSLRDALATLGVPVTLVETARGHLTQLICPDEILPQALEFLARCFGAQAREG